MPRYLNRITRIFVKAACCVVVVAKSLSNASGNVRLDGVKVRRALRSLFKKWHVHFQTSYDSNLSSWCGRPPPSQDPIIIIKHISFWVNWVGRENVLARQKMCIVTKVWNTAAPANLNTIWAWFTWQLNCYCYLLFGKALGFKIAVTLDVTVWVARTTLLYSIALHGHIGRISPTYLSFI